MSMVRNGVVECADPYGPQMMGFRGLACSTRQGRWCVTSISPQWREGLCSFSGESGSVFRQTGIV
jgi:hypothetical protein